MPWLWQRLQTVGPLGPLAWELPYATGSGLKRKSEKEKRKEGKKKERRKEERREGGREEGKKTDIMKEKYF